MYAGTVLLSKEPPKQEPTKIVGLISDTHIPKKALTLSPKTINLFQNVDYIIHAGDLVELTVIDELEQLAPVIAVHGNMDSLATKQNLPNLNILRVLDWKIGVMHDPDIAFGLNKIRALVTEHAFNIFVYGHTHTADIKWEGKTLYINPGSATIPASPLSNQSVAILKLTKESITPEIIEF